MKKLKNPKCKLTGKNGNVFNLMGLAAESLQKAGLRDEVKKMNKECFAAKNYQEALTIICKYVDVI